jgi:hypothetical protein
MQALQTDSFCGRCAKNIRTANLEARCWGCAREDIFKGFIWGTLFGTVVTTLVEAVLA